MIKQYWLRSVMTFAAAAILVPGVAQAQIQRVNPNEHKQAIGFSLGYFVLNGNDSRAHNDDVLWNDQDVLLFDIKDFNGFTFGGEWLLSVGKYLEAGVGTGYYSHSVPSIYRDVTFEGGKEIEQELKLRVIPTTATIRFLPVGHAAIEPYVGAGIGIFSWRYTESGEFVDFTDYSIFRETYEASGTEVGPVVLAGLRVPVGTALAFGGEVRWQSAKGDTKPEQTGLYGSKIDLGGWTTSFTTHIRF